MTRASVVIAVRNGRDFIVAAVDSALAQESIDPRVIVIDDASEDDTQALLFDRYPDIMGSRLIYERNPERMERSRSRNRGFELSDGEFVFFLDADDEWAPGYMKEVLDRFDRSGVDLLCATPRTSIGIAGETLRVSSKRYSGDFAKLVFSARIGITSGLAFRRGAFPGFDPGVIPREDWEILLRTYLGGARVDMLDTEKVKIRKHPGRTSRSTTFRDATLRIYEAYYERVPREHLPWFQLHTAEICMRYQRLGLGWTLAARAIAQRPTVLADPRVSASLLKRGLRIDRALATNARSET